MSCSSQDQHEHRHHHPEDSEEATEDICTATTKSIVDAACARITAAIPEYPYLLSAPVNVEPRYHYPTRQEAESWARNTPFYLHEEGLQYMTYVYREPGQSCFVVRSHIDEERERLQAAQQHQQKLLNNTSKKEVIKNETATTLGMPVAGSGNKKKISFSAYKSKLAEGKVNQKHMSPEKERPVVRMNPREDGRMNGVKTEHKIQKEEQQGSGLKRSRDADLEKHAAEKIPSMKKPRLSSPSIKQSHSPSLRPSPIDYPNGAPHGLPALLSPTNPFEYVFEKSSTQKQNTSNRWDLPDMLSPTLPPKIEAQLQKEKELGKPDSPVSSPASKTTRTSGRSATNSASKSKSSGLTPPEKAKGGISKASMEQSDSETGEDEVSEKPPTQPKMMARLKYSKKVAWQIRQLLRMSPRPDRNKFPLDEDFLPNTGKERATARSVMLQRAGGDNLGSKATSDAMSPIQRPRRDILAKERDRLHLGAVQGKAKTPEKLPKSFDDSEPVSSNKHTAAAALDQEKEKNPRTPIASGAPSGSIKESIVVTPRQIHLKASAMARSVSQDTSVPTPGSKQNHTTPAASTTRSKGPTSAPTPALRAAELRALAAESQRFNALGRQLKHDNQDLASKRKDREQQTEAERKRMALLGIECILAYMLAYSIGDARRKLEGRAAEIETSWRTLLPLFRHMRSFVAHYKPLDGLHSYLGVAINARISTVAADRLARAANAPLAADSPQSAILEPGGSAANNPTMENTKIMVEAFRAMTDCAREAASKLPVEEITHGFPDTWASRATEPRDSTPETLLSEKKAGEVQLRGRYWLPVSVDTSPLQAVRFGAQLVKEWIMLEELGYEPRIRVEKMVM
ncbi:hypothetical protein, variant [Verruconis gallopava]|uniref:Uncharacterized protein n=1 Tax=Verruconis gallopava TaxID=253628 RepID=A0A0D1YD13_9PEZI|nr:uncharacterized protein PV09_09634 [Verruconis gallopava]XP_016208437.1 hypothetical protein, variant [Verruconis gallopava]KIV98566.1 hypothetical protein PV09_09634 [Verruconis gallopava]KIV98567.1 hypothetical protein, variant [Verruconis gallopava]